MRQNKIFTLEFWQFWQTAGIALTLIMAFFPYPHRFISYIMGFCLGFALVHGLLLPKEKKSKIVFRYALPYLILYLTMLISSIFSKNISANLSYCGRYFCLLLIPLVFVGMTPSFLTGRRLRIFAFALVAGALIGTVWKFFVFYQICVSNNLTVYREQGFLSAFRHSYEYFQYFVKSGNYKFEHQAFEALFALMAMGVVLQAWIKKDVFFSHGYSKILTVFILGAIMSNLLFFCTKTAALGCLCSVFVFWLYAIYKKRYAFAGVSAFGTLLLAASLTLCAPEMVLTRFQATIDAAGAFLRGNPVDATDASFVPRVNVYRIGWEMFKEKPILGWGSDYGKEFKQRYEKYSGKQEGWTRSKSNVLGHPHNQALAIMDSAGLVGLLALGWVFFTVLRDVWRRKSLFWWIWFAGLLVICTIDVLFNRTLGFIYLCGFHGILFCERTSDFLHPEDAHKPLVPEKPAEGV